MQIMAIDVDNATAPNTDGPLPPTDVRAAYRYFASGLDNMPGWVARAEKIAHDPEQLAALWCAAIDGAHIQGNPDLAAGYIVELTRGKASRPLTDYLDESPRAVALGHPNFLQLRFVLDAVNRDYRGLSIVGATAAHRALPRFIKAHPVLRESFMPRRVYSPAKQAYVMQRRELPAERTGLVPLMAEAELWVAYPDGLPLQTQRLHCSRLITAAKRAGIDLRHLSGAPRGGLPLRTWDILRQAAAQQERSRPSASLRQTGTAVLRRITMRDRPGWS